MVIQMWPHVSIPNLGIRRKRIVSFRSRAILPPVTIRRYSLDRPQRKPEQGKTSYLWRNIEPRFLGHPARTLIAILIHVVVIKN
jgi:hypothetical protein